MWIHSLALKNRLLKDMDKNAANELIADMCLELGEIEALFADDYFDDFKKILSKYPDQKIATYECFNMDIPGLIRYLDREMFRVYLAAGSEAIFRKRRINNAKTSPTTKT